MSFHPLGLMPANETMQVFAQPPSAALRPFVRRLLVVEFPFGLRDSHLPATGSVAAFPFRGECRLGDGAPAPRAGFTGLWDRLRHHTHSQGNAVALVSFTPTGAAAFLRHPLDELTNTNAPLDSLLHHDGPALATLQDQIGEAPHHARRLQLVEAFLLRRLATAARDPLVTAAVDWLERAAPAARIEDLVRYIGLSQSALERRFRRIVGTSPKRFASLVRLERAARLRDSGATLTSIAHAAGYFDQSHFIHDFKRVTGLAPATYFSSAH